MNISFTATPAAPVLKETITIGGKERGWVELQSKPAAESCKFMAMIALGGNAASNAYGFGPDKESAITNAISKGLDAAAAMRHELEVVQEELTA
jgi:hypothetical protein